MCNHANREAAMVVIDPGTPGRHGRDGVWCDPCLEPLIGALNEGGIATVASCCGHGHRPGNVALADGRQLFIVSEAEDVEQINSLFALDMNGDDIASRASQPVQVEVTDDMVERAAKALGEFVTHGPIDDLSGPNGAYWIREARAALSAALGGGES